MTWDSYNPVKQMSAVYAGVSDDDTMIPTTDEVAWELFSLSFVGYTTKWICVRH